MEAQRCPIRINTTVNPGQLFATFQTPGVFLNALTGPYRDHTTGTPEYKVTAVRVESLEGAARYIGGPAARPCRGNQYGTYWRGRTRCRDEGSAPMIEIQRFLCQLMSPMLITCGSGRR